MPMLSREGERSALVVPLELDDGAACGVDLHLDLVRRSRHMPSTSQMPSSSSTSLIFTMPLSKAMARTSSMLTGPAAAGTARARVKSEESGNDTHRRHLLLGYRGLRYVIDG